jgi:hypothetical protein
VLLNQSGQQVLKVLDAWNISDGLLEVGFDEKLLRGPEEAIDRKVNFADPKAFNIWRTKKAIKEYRHYQMWRLGKNSI